MPVYFVAALLFFMATPSLVGQSWRGQGRLSGRVLDEKGKAIKGARVMLRSARAGNSGPDVTTDAKGKWAALGLIGGGWNIDVEAAGFVTRKTSIQVSEFERRPPMDIKLERAAAPPPPKQEVPENVASTVPPEIVAAVQKGEALMKEASALSGAPQKTKYKEAIIELEKARSLLPEHVQLKQVLARAYYGAGLLPSAIELLTAVHEADPTNAAVLLLLTNVLLENGQLDEGRAMLARVPPGTMTDPTALINIGILFLNKEKPADANEYFTRAIALDAKRGESYYYRGLAALQLKKLSSAKADFEKTLALAPNSSEAKDAAEMLKAMK